jgi:S1-C subfamily serine protease
MGLKMSISSGIVSSSDVVLPISNMSWDEPYIQTDAAINPGNSGAQASSAASSQATRSRSNISTTAIKRP